VIFSERRITKQIIFIANREANMINEVVLT